MIKKIQIDIDPSKTPARNAFMQMEHIQARTLHARRGTLKNVFSYGVDFVLTDLEEATPRLMSRNRFNLWSLWDRHHGGARRGGQGMAWFREVLDSRGFQSEAAQLLLLTQPSFLWFHFNPVSFWIALIDGTPRAFVAEVNNTFGQRHCYFCAHEDFRTIRPADTLIAEKIMHVSPFQRVSGVYRFNFNISETKIDIRISFEDGDKGVLATLSGHRRIATDKSLMWAAARRPFGALRVLALIHWQAAKLYLKRAPFLKRQPAPTKAITVSQNLGRASE
ncbi:DUF1365 domain-containing protein [Ruegeria alba]|uniref:DUF1365 domain-containing protein n=1 Tax=Ruegeria alba TaxID=2916756 RepID=UPI003F72BAC2